MPPHRWHPGAARRAGTWTAQCQVALRYLSQLALGIPAGSVLLLLILWAATVWTISVRSLYYECIIPFSMLPLLAQLGMRRKVLMWFLAALSGHGHFGVYDQRFSHEIEEDWWRIRRKYHNQQQTCSRTSARVRTSLLWSKKAQTKWESRRLCHFFWSLELE